jgi:hypothetical protein
VAEMSKIEDRFGLHGFLQGVACDPPDRIPRSGAGGNPLTRRWAALRPPVHLY